jgi:hypothetical protein
MGPTDSETDLAEVQAEFPGWEIESHWFGYTARPKGTPLIEAMFLDGLAEKLRQQPN